MVDWQPRRELGAYRLRIRNLPSSYATFAPGSASRLRDLLWDSLRVATHNVRTKPRWHSEDWHWAFAFLETMTELDGTRLIHTIHTNIVQAVPLRAEWTHDSGPALARDSVIVRVGLPELDLLCFQHPLYGPWRVTQGGAVLPRDRWPPLGHLDPPPVPPPTQPHHHPAPSSTIAFDVSESDGDGGDDGDGSWAHNPPPSQLATGGPPNPTPSPTPPTPSTPLPSVLPLALAYAHAAPLSRDPWATPPSHPHPLA